MGPEQFETGRVKMTSNDKTPRKPDGKAQEGPPPARPTDSDRPGNTHGAPVEDPHPDTEEGYDRKHKVPMTGL